MIGGYVLLTNKNITIIPSFPNYGDNVIRFFKPKNSFLLPSYRTGDKKDNYDKFNKYLKQFTDKFYCNYCYDREAVFTGHSLVEIITIYIIPKFLEVNTIEEYKNCKTFTIEEIYDLTKKEIYKLNDRWSKLEKIRQKGLAKENAHKNNNINSENNNVNNDKKASKRQGWLRFF